MLSEQGNSYQYPPPQITTSDDIRHYTLDHSDLFEATNTLTHSYKVHYAPNVMT